MAVEEDDLLESVVGQAPAHVNVDLMKFSQSTLMVPGKSMTWAV
jgi:hypothetical protein